MSWINPFLKESPGHSCDPPFTLPPIIEVGDKWQCDYCGAKWIVVKINDNRTADYAMLEKGNKHNGQV